jgi:hypothetical protein
LPRHKSASLREFYCAIAQKSLSVEIIGWRKRIFKFAAPFIAYRGAEDGGLLNLPTLSLLAAVHVFC